MASMKKLSAKYPGTCRKCGQKFPAGTEIMWGGGVTEHVTCPGLTVAPSVASTSRAPLAAGGSVPKGTNRKAGDCEDCGEWLPAGKGRLVYCVEDSGCMKHHDYSGYHLYCQDESACADRRKALREAAKKQKEERARKAEEEKARKEAEAAAFKSMKATLLTGLSQTSCPLPDPSKLVRGNVVGRDDSGFYRCSLTEATYDASIIALMVSSCACLPRRSSSVIAPPPLVLRQPAHVLNRVSVASHPRRLWTEDRSR